MSDHERTRPLRLAPVLLATSLWGCGPGDEPPSLDIDQLAKAQELRRESTKAERGEPAPRAKRAVRR